MSISNYTSDDISAADIEAREHLYIDVSENEFTLQRGNLVLASTSSTTSIHSSISDLANSTVRPVSQRNQVFIEMQEQSETARESTVENRLSILERLTIGPRMVLYIHLIFTLILLILKIIVAIISSSMSIRSLIGDSAVDLINLSLLLGATYLAKRNKRKYPLGRANIETLSILAMAVFMTGMLGGVIVQAGSRLWSKYQYFYYFGEKPEKANINRASALIVAALIVIKLILLSVCMINKSAQAKALSKDHRVDIFMNISALVLGYLGSWGTHGDWKEKLIIIDDIGAICLASYGIYIWVPQIREHIRRVCHRIIDDDETTEEIRSIAETALHTVITENEDICLGSTIVCHAGGDKTIIIQMVVLPEDIDYKRIKLIFNALKIALIKQENTGHVIVLGEE